LGFGIGLINENTVKIFLKLPIGGSIASIVAGLLFGLILLFHSAFSQENHPPHLPLLVLGLMSVVIGAVCLNVIATFKISEHERPGNNTNPLQKEDFEV